MRKPWLVLLVLPLLCGCAAAAGPLVAANVASVVAVGRDPADIVVSVVSGRDCGIIRLARGQSYCRPVEAAAAPPLYCTRSLGVADCWDKPNPFGYYQRPMADGAWAPTELQEQNRTARWPEH
jgi:hypothetical protein